MKNKKSVYVLLPLVLLIWGTIIYQLFSYSNTDEIIDQSTSLIVKPLVLKPRDTFSIDVNYRDPFFGKMYVEKSEKSNIENTIKKTQNRKEKIIWPKIIYKGIVSDTKDKVKVFMLIIEGKTFLMKKGETQSEIFLKDGNRESLVVKYKGHVDTLFLEENN